VGGSSRNGVVGSALSDVITVMSTRGPTKKFFYDIEHDVVLYALFLESGLFDEEKGDFVYTRSGQIKLKSGWEAVAITMTKVFGRKFSGSALNDRMNRFFNYELYANRIADEAMELASKMATVSEVLDA
jgi:hypothetical protein